MTVVRLMVRDKVATRASAAKLLQWPIRRALVAHNAALETKVRAQLANALEAFG